MAADSVIDAVAREFVDFCLEDVAEDDAGSYENHCAYAQVFARWAEGMLDEYVRSDPKPVRLAQAKVLLVDRFFEWRTAVPRNHRNRIGDNGHICLFHVFDQAYQQIRLAQLTVTPPQLYLPPPPQQPEIGGVPWGIKK